MSEPNDTIKQLKVIRLELNISRNIIAIRLGVSPSTVQAWENGRQAPSLDNIKRIEALLRRLKK